MDKIMGMIKRDLKYFYYTKIKNYSEREIYINHLRRIGMKIGEECYFFSEKIETAEPYLVSIGDHVTIAPDVKFSTHDASANFYHRDTSDIYGEIIIGNYVFIGIGTIVLPGVTIADHCIIGAGSVVTKSFLEENGVIAGNPAKVICKVSDLKEKNKRYEGVMTWGMTFEQKKKYLMENKNLFKVN